MRVAVLSLFSSAALVVACTNPADRMPSPGPTGGAVATGGTGTGGATGGSVGTGGVGTGGATGGSSGDGGAPGTGGSGPTDGGAPSADASEPSTPQAGAPCPKCVKIFNGTTFDGWEAAPATWKIVAGGAMHGEGGTSRAAYTKADYGNVRLIFSTQMNPVNGDHLGVLFWGNRPTNPAMPTVDNAGWLQYMPNYAGMWSYHPPKDKGLPAMKVGMNPTSWTTWHTVELLLNLDKGTVRAAADGVEVMKYTWTNPTERTDPLTRIIPGPICMMKHGGGGSEYKDIWVESNPTEDKLYTVK
jgi:hypothetical protein